MPYIRYCWRNIWAATFLQWVGDACVYTVATNSFHRVPAHCHGNCSRICYHGVHWILCEAHSHPNQQHHCVSPHLTLTLQQHAHPFQMGGWMLIHSLLSLCYIAPASDGNIGLSDLVPWDQLPRDQLHQINLARDQLPWDQLNFYNTWTLIGECNLPNQLYQINLERVAFEWW